MKSLTQADLDKIKTLKGRINCLRNEINHITEKADWKELANIPEFKLEAIIKYRVQNGGTLANAKTSVESYLISTLPI